MKTHVWKSYANEHSILCPRFRNRHSIWIVVQQKYVTGSNAVVVWLLHRVIPRRAANAVFFADLLYDEEYYGTRDIVTFQNWMNNLQRAANVAWLVNGTCESGDNCTDLAVVHHCVSSAILTLHIEYRCWEESSTEQLLLTSFGKQLRDMFVLHIAIRATEATVLLRPGLKTLIFCFKINDFITLIFYFLQCF